MDKTKVDDIFMEMLSPKIEEIEKKFTSGKEPLTHQDINTLLLKSQYNHINHLDMKLNEVTDSVKSLENRFNSLESKFSGLEGKFDTFKAEIKAELQQSQKEIQQSINKTITWLVGGAGVLLFIFKALDTFAK
jgi:predicted RNase H-like nuclease (RuvC/YqgF family)